ncbi:conserved protein of unknown function (plasmid) [Rhodovastum atsumiense]|uniref:Uncharacterized protein n=1 Tax=Rhodovastum atsumiense TaxID=504468 RepID=A0A5M6IU98_9PROT|nr:hypothetical protein [Rhodovastum atsumiense]KAA5611854.1 hypothetical protein F1189_12535 [Rhodovastum atsumiense]CAH2606169.1 conserved protein of unknown function [Rhodovastum atsumiense]
MTRAVEFTEVDEATLATRRARMKAAAEKTRAMAREQDDAEAVAEALSGKVSEPMTVAEVARRLP